MVRKSGNPQFLGGFGNSIPPMLAIGWHRNTHKSNPKSTQPNEVLRNGQEWMLREEIKGTQRI